MKTLPNPLFALEQALGDVHRLVATISDPEALNRAAAAEILSTALIYQKALTDMFNLLGVPVDPSPQADRIGVLFHAAGQFGAQALSPASVRKAVALAAAKLTEARQLVSDADTAQVRSRATIAELQARAAEDRKTIAGLRTWANRAYEVSQAGGRFAPYTNDGGEFCTINSTLVTLPSEPEAEPDTAVDPQSQAESMGPESAMDIDLDSLPPWAVYEAKPDKPVASQSAPRAPALTRVRRVAKVPASSISMAEINLDDLL